MQTIQYFYRTFLLRLLLLSVISLNILDLVQLFRLEKLLLYHRLIVLLLILSVQIPVKDIIPLTVSLLKLLMMLLFLPRVNGHLEDMSILLILNTLRKNVVWIKSMTTSRMSRDINSIQLMIIVFRPFESI